MKRITALIGTRSKKSNTQYLCELIVSVMNEHEHESDYEVEYIRPGDLDIKPCQGCSLCFRTGECPQKDDIDMLKEKLLSADYIILGSPVYAASVTSDMKLWIDRLSVWLHIMPLIGKRGAIVSTASGNNENSVIDYLERMALSFGIQLDYKYNVYVDAGSDVLLRNEDAVKKEIRTLLRKERTVSETQENLFRYYNRRFSKMIEIGKKYPSLMTGESKLWEEQGYNKYDTINEVIAKLPKGEQQ